MAEFSAYTDGACSGNPGPGGWGVWLIASDCGKIISQREFFGGEENTTNNRMELMAAIMALEMLKKPTKITLHTDSMYVKDGITHWIKGWKKRNWRRSNNMPVKNCELWQRLDCAQMAHMINWQWIKGHAGNEGNEYADMLARKGIMNLQIKTAR